MSRLIGYAAVVVLAGLVLAYAAAIGPAAWGGP
jgi:hypothetical protein